MIERMAKIGRDHGLETEIDRERDEGVEPNVWMMHPPHQATDL